MPKGSSSNSGPAPSADALRRDRKDDQNSWSDLPEGGRDDPPPGWPLLDAAPREVELWEALWRKPQAVMWEANQLEVLVALFVRNLIVAEQPDAPTARTTEVRRMMDDLGLTHAGMQARRWRIASSVKASKPRKRSQSSARDRLKVVSGGDTA